MGKRSRRDQAIDDLAAVIADRLHNRPVGGKFDLFERHDVDALQQGVQRIAPGRGEFRPGVNAALKLDGAQDRDIGGDRQLTRTGDDGRFAVPQRNRDAGIEQQRQASEARPLGKFDALALARFADRADLLQGSQRGLETGEARRLLLIGKKPADREHITAAFDRHARIGRERDGLGQPQCDAVTALERLAFDMPHGRS